MQNMQDPSGWSLTSGGPSSGITLNPYLGEEDYHCIFDQNSGPARLLSGNMSVRSVDMTNSAVMEFSSNSYILVARSSVLRAKLKDLTLHYYSQEISLTNKTIDLRGCEITGVLSVYHNWALAAPVSITGAIKVLGNPSVEAFLYAKGYKIVCAAFYMFASGGTYQASFYAAGGELELTGARVDWGEGGAVRYALLAIPTTCTFHMQGGTLRVSNKDASVNKILSGAIDPALTKTNLGNFINDTARGVEWISGTNGYVTTFVSYDAGKGVVNRFAPNNYYTAKAWILDGAGQYTTLHTTNFTTGETRAQLTKAGGGQVVANYCKFQNITIATGTNIRALNSVDLGGNTGTTIAYSYVNSRFLSHYHC